MWEKVKWYEKPPMAITSAVTLAKTAASFEWNSHWHDAICRPSFIGLYICAKNETTVLAVIKCLSGAVLSPQLGWLPCENFKYFR